MVGHLALAQLGEREGAAVEIANDPLPGDGVLQEGGSQGAGDVGAALAPIETGIGETPPEGSGWGYVDAEVLECFHAGASDVVGFVTAGGIRDEPAFTQELVMQRDGDGSCHVVVTGAGLVQGGGGAGDELFRDAAGEDSKMFEKAGDLGAAQRVVAVAALGCNADELGFSEAVEVGAGGGGRDFRERCEFGTGARMTVEQGEQHAGSCWLADGRGDFGEERVFADGGAGG